MQSIDDIYATVNIIKPSIHPFAYIIEPGQRMVNFLESGQRSDDLGLRCSDTNQIFD